jgi:hypothetical protein
MHLMAGRLAPASEVAGGHTIQFAKERGLPILKWYGMMVLVINVNERAWRPA